MVLGKADSSLVGNKDPKTSHFVVITGEPLREALVQQGPFVIKKFLRQVLVSGMKK